MFSLLTKSLDSPITNLLYSVQFGDCGHPTSKYSFPHIPRRRVLPDNIKRVYVYKESMKREV
jgi:hypothetical protein